MRNPHEPHDDFVERLQWQIRAEVRRRNRLEFVDRSPARPRWRVAVAALGLAIVSMGAGGAAVSAAYQAQANEQGALLAARYQQRAALEKERLAITKQKLAESERRVQLGIAGTEDVLEDRTTLAELEGRVAVLELQAQEVRASGREVTDGVTAPLVAGRDFVTERWLIELRALTASLEYENVRLREVTRRFEVGVVGQSTVVDARARVDELQSAVAGFSSRLALRQRFVKKEIDAAEAELRLLEAEAQLRQKSLQLKLGVARQKAERVSRLFEVGLANRVQVAEEQLKMHEIEADLAKASVDLAIVQAKIAERRGK